MLTFPVTFMVSKVKYHKLLGMSAISSRSVKKMDGEISRSGLYFICSAKFSDKFFLHKCDD